MIKRIYSSLFALLSLFILLGCSNESKITIFDDQPHYVNKTKISRTDWVILTKPGQSDIGLLEKSFDFNMVEIKLTKGEKKGSHYQFFIDTDKNPHTGYNDGWIADGADYLIEDARVYKSLSNSHEWRWERVDSVTFSNSDTTVYTAASADLFENIQTDFRVSCVCLDRNWDYISKIGMIDLDQGAVKIDADASDWENIPTAAISDFGEFKFYQDEKRVYFLTQNGSIAQHTQIFINTDNDTDSGYLPQGGADYLIEDDRLYASLANSDSWEWERIAYVTFAKEGDLLELGVLKDKIKLSSNSIFLSAISWNEDFNTEVSRMDKVLIDLNARDRKSLIVSEVMASNAHTLLDPDFFAFSDWIEIYNASFEDMDIGGFYLSDSLKDGKWEIPQGTIIGANKRIVFWADGKDSVQKAMHTDFTLKAKGEEVALFDRNGELVDGFSFDEQKSDVSCTIDDGRLVYMEPTPGERNSKAYDSSLLSQKPTFSVSGGFYENRFEVAIVSSDDATIYYTTDGSLPTKNSNIYDKPILIDKTTILRARAKSGGKFLSEDITATYFINEDISLAVVSIATDRKYLFDDQIGIYTTGTNGASSFGCTQEDFKANYFQDWSRPAHIEFFDEEKNPGFSQEIELAVSGSCSRIIPQKSLKITADGKYGNKKISYKLFENKPFTEYKGFKLKSSGQDWFQTMIRDPFLHRVIKDDLDVDYQDYRPCVVFINGEYYGIHNIREKKNRDFIVQNHPGVKKKKIDLLYDNGGVKKGSAKNYIDMIEYIENHDLGIDENYQEVASRMDIENYIDYMIAETYYLNQDWPYTNVRFWRENKEGAKWRWIFEDQDVAFGPWDDPMDINIFEFITSVENLTYANPLWSTFLFRSLIKNAGFKARFKEKYYNYLNSVFQPDRMHEILDEIVSKIEPQMQRHIRRWRGTYEETIESFEMWRYYLAHMRDMIDTRNQRVRLELEAF